MKTVLVLMLGIILGVGLSSTIALKLYVTQSQDIVSSNIYTVVSNIKILEQSGPEKLTESLKSGLPNSLCLLTDMEGWVFSEELAEPIKSRVEYAKNLVSYEPKNCGSTAS